MRYLLIAAFLFMPLAARADDSAAFRIMEQTIGSLAGRNAELAATVQQRDATIKSLQDQIAKLKKPEAQDANGNKASPAK